VSRGYLQAFAAAQASAAQRLIPSGETDAQRALAELTPICADVAREAMAADPDDLGGAVVGADLASMRHETQRTRLFRS